MISFKQVCAGYPGKTVLTGINLTINQGEFVVVIGPNGSGKSTLLKVILGLLPPARGELSVLGFQGREVPRARDKIGYLSQASQVDLKYPVTALGVVIMGSYGELGLWSRPGLGQREDAYRCLEEVGLKELASSPYGRLSGGQRQRVLLARSLMGSPELLLLDEPTTALDVAAQHELVGLLARLNKEKNITVVMVTHDVNLVSGHADKIGYLKGSLVAFGPPNEVLHQELLSKVYDAKVLVIEHKGQKRVVVNDHHV